MKFAVFHEIKIDVYIKVAPRAGHMDAASNQLLVG
jgi:hypothetical protein